MSDGIHDDYTYDTCNNETTLTTLQTKSTFMFTLDLEFPIDLSKMSPSPT